MKSNLYIMSLLAQVLGSSYRDAEAAPASDSAVLESLELNLEEQALVKKGEVVWVRPRSSGPQDLIGESATRLDAAESLGSAAFLSVVQSDSLLGEATSVSQAVARSAGVHAQGLGGLGAFSSLSIRGGSSAQTTVFIDGVPISTLAGASQDLSLLDFQSFSNATLYRGSGVSFLSEGGMGGTLSLNTRVGVPASGKRLRSSGGVGSFGSKHVRGRYLQGNRERGFASHASFGIMGAHGDFSFFDDNGTRLNPDDDRISIRQNNGFERATAVLRLQHRSEEEQIQVGLRFLHKGQELAGPTRTERPEASLTSTNPIVDASWTRVTPGLGRVGLSSFGSVEVSTFKDLNREIGLLAQEQRQVTLSGGLYGDLEMPLGPHSLLMSRVEGRYEWFEQDARVGPRLPVSQGQRLRSAVGFGYQQSDSKDLFTLDLGVRGEALRTQPTSDSFEREGQVDPRSLFFVAPKVALLFRPSETVAIKSNGGRYLRPPTLMEIFGDRGLVLGNPDLKAEQGWTADLGIVLAPYWESEGLDRIFLEGAAFATRNQDSIVFTARNGQVSQAQNLSGAWLRGAELTGSARILKKITSTWSYSYLWTESASSPGVRLPNRPMHRLDGRVDIADRILKHFVNVFAEFTYQSGNVLDAANVFELPGRKLLGIGVKYAPSPDWLVALHVRNVTDSRVESLALDPPPRADLTQIPRALADIYGFPLPGRALYLSTEWIY